MMQCKTCGCYPKGNICHVCDSKLVPVEEKPKYIRIRPLSKKRHKETVEYNAKAKVFLQKNRFCAVFPSQKSNQVHHMKGRIGDLLLNEEFWLPVSQDGHEKITNNSQWAFDNGFSLLRI